VAEKMSNGAKEEYVVEERESRAASFTSRVRWTWSVVEGKGHWNQRCASDSSVLVGGKTGLVVEDHFRGGTISMGKKATSN